MVAVACNRCKPQFVIWPNSADTRMLYGIPYLM
jgi:hypothetical protein